MVAKNTYHNAKLEILWYLTQFCLSLRYNDKTYPHEVETSFHSGFSNKKPPIGTLVTLSYAPSSKWYLGWLLEIGETQYGPNYLIRSIEDGTDCWWSNVGIRWLDIEEVNKWPEWKWNDRQFKFNKRLKRICYKKNDAYLCLPCLPIFHPDDSVTLSFRERWGDLDSKEKFSYQKTIPNYKKVLSRELDAIYREAEKEFDRFSEERKIKWANEKALQGDNNEKL